MAAADPTDFELLAGWRAGDNAAGTQLFERHFSAIFGFFRSKLEHVAEDLTQETLLRCLRGIDGYRGTSSFRTYLFTIARNVLFSHLARKANRPMPDFEVASLADLDDSASARLEGRERSKLLIHALRRLPVDLQITLELYYVQRLRGAELVEVVGLPAGTVRSRIRRAIEQLRANLEALSSSPERVKTTLTDLHHWAAAVRAGHCLDGRLLDRAP